MVPNEWIKTTLGNLTKGSAFGPRFSSDLYLENGSVGVIRTTDLDAEGNINYSTIPYANVPESFDAHHLEEGDLLITRSGTCGIPCIFQKQAKPIVAGAFLIRFILNEKVNAAFLHALLKSKDVQVSIQNLASGGVQKNLTGTNLKKLELCIPPIPEQKKIAQILSTWDQAISATEKLLAKSQQQKKALMQQLLTGKKRLLDENGLKFNIPWEKYRLGTLLKEGKQRNKDNSLSRVLSVTNHSGFVLPENQFSKRIASDEVSNYKVVIKGQFGYNPSRINVGSFARLDQFDNGLLSPMYVVFSITSEKLDSDFFLYWMKSNEAKQRINNSTQGSVRDSVGFDAISSFALKLPKIQEQRKIAKVLSLADQEIETLQKKLDYLKQEKKALMQQLLTGKRRVKV